MKKASKERREPISMDRKEDMNTTFPALNDSIGISERQKEKREENVQRHE